MSGAPTTCRSKCAFGRSGSTRLSPSRPSRPCGFWLRPGRRTSSICATRTTTPARAASPTRTNRRERAATAGALAWPTSGASPPPSSSSWSRRRCTRSSSSSTSVGFSTASGRAAAGAASRSTGRGSTSSGCRAFAGYRSAPGPTCTKRQRLFRTRDHLLMEAEPTRGAARRLRRDHA